MFGIFKSFFKRTPPFTEGGKHKGCASRDCLREVRSYGVDVQYEKDAAFFAKIIGVEGSFTIIVKEGLPSHLKNYAIGFVFESLLLNKDPNRSNMECTLINIISSTSRNCSALFHEIEYSTRKKLIISQYLEHLIYSKNVTSPTTLAECFDVPDRVLVDRLKDLNWV